MLLIPVFLAFLAMGVVAVVSPATVLELLGSQQSTPLSRNEARSVYGSFGLVTAAVILWAPMNGDAGRGALMAVTALLGAMALIRMIGVFVDRPGPLGWIYLLLEVSGTGCLLHYLNG